MVCEGKGEAAHPVSPRIRVLLDLASQWSEVPATVSAEAKLRELWARTSLSTVVVSSRVGFGVSGSRC